MSNSLTLVSSQSSAAGIAVSCPCLPTLASTLSPRIPSPCLSVLLMPYKVGPQVLLGQSLSDAELLKLGSGPKSSGLGFILSPGVRPEDRRKGWANHPCAQSLGAQTSICCWLQKSPLLSVKGDHCTQATGPLHVPSNPDHHRPRLDHWSRPPLPI